MEREAALKARVVAFFSEVLAHGELDALGAFCAQDYVPHCAKLNGVPALEAGLASRCRMMRHYSRKRSLFLKKSSAKNFALGTRAWAESRKAQKFLRSFLQKATAYLVTTPRRPAAFARSPSRVKSGSA